MVQTSLSTQTKVLLVSTAAVAAGLAAYALGYYDYDWRLWQTTPPQAEQQVMPVAPVEGTTPQPQQITATVVGDTRLPDAVVGTAYSFRLNASTGEGTYWALEQGALPSGLVLNEQSGVISGIATLPGSSLFRLKFGTAQATGLSQFTLNVVSGAASDTVQTQVTGQQGVITTTYLPGGKVGEAYVATVQASGDEMAGRSWRLHNAPQGFSITQQGEIRGTPTQTGSLFISVVLTTHDVGRPAHPYEIIRQYSVSIAPADPVVTEVPFKISSMTSLPAGKVGVEYKYQFTAVGGPAGTQYAWQIPGSVPGLTGSEDGILRGVPTAPGTYTLQNVKVTGRNAANTGAAGDFTLQILPREEVAVPDSGPAPLIISGGYPDGGIGGYYSSNPLQVSGGQAPYEWSVSNGNIPSGLSFSPNGQIGGYANQYGIFTFTVQVRDQANRYARAERTIHIRPAQPVISASIDPDLSNRLRRIDLMGVQVHDLIKLQDDGNPDTQFDTTVYYIGADGRRHSFPNPKVYFTWFRDFSRVRIVAGRELADVPLGANLTYRPGSRLVKFTTDPRVYAVDSDRRLRWVKIEATAQALYGPFWARQVDDVSDAFYMDYRIGQEIDRAADYSVSGAMGTAVFPSDVLPR